MKFFFVAGERSGDLHGANLIKEIKRLDFEAEVVGFGGDMMEEQGMKLLQHYSKYSFMGLWEVIAHLGTIKKKLKECKEEIKKTAPDVLVLVDFPGFNLRMAGFAKSLGIKTCYYISPKIWAWKKGRIKTIRKVVDKMLVILPFEVEFFNELNFEVEYVGNPLMDAVRTYDFDNKYETNTTTVAVLPGSRVQELKSAKKVILEMAKLKTDYKFVVAGVNNLPKAMYADLEALKNVEVIFEKTYDILKQANAAVVTSGTATLEACLLSAPQVVVYRTSWLTYKVGRAIINVEYLSLVNLIANRPVVKELIQEDFNATMVLEEVDKILNDPAYCGNMLAEYQEIKEKIGHEPASKRAANSLMRWLKPPSAA
ncbi:MAG: lipid-A-disaccharide synthase [Cytophagales bacterium]|nr:lipid-A-disaccharide synthase [Cytophagales bacterium]